MEAAASDYTITTLVGFHVLGWSGNGSNRGGAMSRSLHGRTGGFTGDPATVGDDNKPCLYGYVTSFTSTDGRHDRRSMFREPALERLLRLPRQLTQHTRKDNPTS